MWSDLFASTLTAVSLRHATDITYLWRVWVNCTTTSFNDWTLSRFKSHLFPIVWRNPPFIFILWPINYGRNLMKKWYRIRLIFCMNPNNWPCNFKSHKSNETRKYIYCFRKFVIGIPLKIFQAVCIDLPQAECSSAGRLHWWRVSCDASSKVVSIPAPCRGVWMSF